MEMQLTQSYPLVAREATDEHNYGFKYQDLNFSQSSLHIFAGLNAVDNAANVAATFSTLQILGLNCARMGAFKPRTNPYSFQGLGAQCLPYVFELAGKYNIRVLAMEITHDSQLELITKALALCGNPTGVMLQIGTRNAQNFELLKAVGAQTRFPILYKRGYGITLEESIAACEYIAHAGNPNIIFCLRGMKSQFAAPHRNFVDFAHVPVIKRLTKLPVCVDPSHAIGDYSVDLDRLPDIFNVSAQGIIAGANMLLVDVHPQPKAALVDAKQAISLQHLEHYIEDVKLCRQTYMRRRALALSIAGVTA